MDDANEIERLKAELVVQSNMHKLELERVKAEGVEVYWNQEIKRLNAELKRLSLLAESYRAIIGKLLIYGRERPDAYDTYYEAEAEARAALEIDQK